MHNVSLGNSGITTTAIGFGCTGLMRPDTERERFMLLDAALESGIRHFDVARYYGHGGAEGALGRFLAAGKHRDQVTITTKFGLEPAVLGQSKHGKSLMGLARRMASLHPWIRKIMAGYANRTVRANRFDPQSAERSLETSLRELRTDRVDFLLLHEATLADTQIPGLFEFLEEIKRAGKIRAFGLGTDVANVPGIIAQAPGFTRIVQIANGVGHWHLAQLPSDPERATITHGALKGLSTLKAVPARNWEQFGSSLPGLLLGLSLHENSNGVTLFSSLQPDRVRENVEAALKCSAIDSAAWADFKLTLQHLA